MPWRLFWTVGWLLLFAGLVIGAVSLLAMLVGRRGAGPVHDPALEIPERRCASGEISREEYLRIREELGRR